MRSNRSTSATAPRSYTVRTEGGAVHRVSQDEMQQLVRSRIQQARSTAAGLISRQKMRVPMSPSKGKPLSPTGGKPNSNFESPSNISTKRTGQMRGPPSPERLRSTPRAVTVVSNNPGNDRVGKSPTFATGASLSLKDERENCPEIDEGEVSVRSESEGTRRMSQLEMSEYLKLKIHRARLQLHESEKKRTPDAAGSPVRPIVVAEPFTKFDDDVNETTNRKFSWSSDDLSTSSDVEKNEGSEDLLAPKKSQNCSAQYDAENHASSMHRIPALETSPNKNQYSPNLHTFSDHTYSSRAQGPEESMEGALVHNEAATHADSGTSTTIAPVGSVTSSPGPSEENENESPEDLSVMSSSVRLLPQDEHSPCVIRRPNFALTESVTDFHAESPGLKNDRKTPSLADHTVGAWKDAKQSCEKVQSDSTEYVTRTNHEDDRSDVKTKASLLRKSLEQKNRQIADLLKQTQMKKEVIQSGMTVPKAGRKTLTKDEIDSFVKDSVRQAKENAEQEISSLVNESIQKARQSAQEEIRELLKDSITRARLRADQMSQEEDFGPGPVGEEGQSTRRSNTQRLNERERDSRQNDEPKIRESIDDMAGAFHDEGEKIICKSNREEEVEGNLLATHARPTWLRFRAVSLARKDDPPTPRADPPAGRASWSNIHGTYHADKLEAQETLLQNTSPPKHNFQEEEKPVADSPAFDSTVSRPTSKHETREIINATGPHLPSPSQSKDGHAAVAVSTSSEIGVSSPVAVVLADENEEPGFIKPRPVQFDFETMHQKMIPWDTSCEEGSLGFDKSNAGGDQKAENAPIGLAYRGGLLVLSPNSKTVNDTAYCRPDTPAVLPKISLPEEEEISLKRKSRENQPHPLCSIDETVEGKGTHKSTGSDVYFTPKGIEEARDDEEESPVNKMENESRETLPTRSQVKENDLGLGLLDPIVCASSENVDLQLPSQAIESQNSGSISSMSNTVQSVEVTEIGTAIETSASKEEIFSISSTSVVSFPDDTAHHSNPKIHYRRRHSPLVNTEGSIDSKSSEPDSSTMYDHESCGKASFADTRTQAKGSHHKKQTELKTSSRSSRRVSDSLVVADDPSSWLLGRLAEEFDRAADKINDLIEDTDSRWDADTTQGREKEMQQLGSFAFSHGMISEMVSEGHQSIPSYDDESDEVQILSKGSECKIM